ncbi:class II glutamine amidotransferase domain-containing protein [Baffinella frigidus]|nr:class II glutamine amidotransferase domain-containing protein [Cryptophyta sp. CCMP2293]
MESTAKKLVHFQEETPKQGLYNPEEEHDACGVGFVADLTGTHTRATITDALHVLNHLTHRGACGCESETGDGAGIIVGMPDKFLRKVAKAEGVDLPPKGRYAVANIFFVKDEKHVAAQKKVFDEVVSSFGLNVLLWRKMPVRPTYGKGLGATAMACEPYQEQLFVGAPDNVATEQGFNALLFEVRQKAQYSTDAIMAGLELYICSLSANVVTYKGMLKSEQVMEYYQDLEDVDFESHCAMVHSRFATNTFPAWSRAHPYRYIAHNGEINTDYA